MIRSFALTMLFWSLFIITNSVTDAILFYSAFPWYKNMDLWHFLKFWWIGFAVLTGVFAIRLWMNVKYTIYRVLARPYSGIMSFEFNSGGDWVLKKKKKYRLKSASIFGFLLLYFLFLRWILFEELMKKWSGQ